MPLGRAIGRPVATAGLGFGLGGLSAIEGGGGVGFVVDFVPYPGRYRGKREFANVLSRLLMYQIAGISSSS